MSKVSSGSGSSSTVRTDENDPKSDFIMAWQKEFTTSFKSDEQFIFNSKDDISISSTGSQVQVASSSKFDGIGNNIGGNTNGAVESANDGILGKLGGSLVDWFKDGWAQFKDVITLGLAAIVAAGLIIVLAVIVGGVSAEKGEEEKAAGGVKRRLDKTVKERIAKLVSFNINDYVNTRVQKALFGANFKDIKEKEKQGKELSFREKIGRASDRVVNFDAIDRVINQGLQKAFLGVTSKRLNEEGYITTSRPTGDKKDGTFRLNKSKERDFKSFKRAHTFNMIVKFDIFKATNEVLQTAVLKGTFKEINDNLYKSQKYIENYKEKNNDKETERFDDYKEAMDKGELAIVEGDSPTTIVEVAEDALFEFLGIDEEVYFFEEYADAVSGNEESEEIESVMEVEEVVSTDNTTDEPNDSRNEEVEIELIPEQIDSLDHETSDSNEEAEEVTEESAAEESQAEEVTEEQQEEMIETIETEDGEVVVVDYSSDFEEVASDEANEEDSYAEAESLKEELKDEYWTSWDDLLSEEDTTPEFVTIIIDAMPDDVDKILNVFAEPEIIDIEFTEIEEVSEQSEHQSEEQAEDFEGKSFDDVQSEPVHETINEGIVGDIDQDGVVDQTDAPEEESPDDDEAEETKEESEEAMEDAEEEIELVIEEKSEVTTEEPQMLMIGYNE